MNTNIIFEFIGQLPDLIAHHLVSNTTQAFNNQLRTEFKLSDKEWNSVADVQTEFLKRTLLPQNAPEMLSKKAGMDTARALEISKRLWQEFCGPIRWYFPGLAAVIAPVGGALRETDFFPIAQPSITKTEVVDELLKICDDVPPKIKENVRVYFTKLIATQAFTPSEIAQQLSLPVTEGGWGISVERTQQIISTYRNYIAIYLFTDEQPAPEPKKIDPASLQPNAAEVREAADVQQGAPAAQAVAESPLSVQQQAIVEAVLEAEDLRGLSDDMLTRWISIVETRVRGLRDAEKTKTLLLSSAAQGGLGFSPEDAERIATMLEQTVKGFETKRTEMSVLEKIASVQKQSAALATGPEEKQKEVQKELNERFVNMFGKNAVEEMRRETHREIETSQKAHPEEKNTQLVAAPIAPVVVIQPAEVAPAPAPVLPPPKYVIKVPDKLRQLIDADSPMLPLKSQQPEALAQARLKKNADIRANSSRLISPTDELRTMSIVDFRRLSPDVSVRIQKIRSKIEVIAQDGAMEKINALKAIEQSEPVKIYRELIKASLIQGRSMTDISNEHKLAKQPYLEPEEIEILKDFLKQIRYSSL